MTTSTDIRWTPLTGPSVWRGPEIARLDGWRHRLTAAEVVDLEAALARAKAQGRAMTDLTRADLPLPVLGAVIERWMEILQRGRGFVNVNGLPADRLGTEDLALMQWGIGSHMGTAVSQNAAGDVLGHVRDTGADPKDPSVRLYRTRVGLQYLHRLGVGRRGSGSRRRRRGIAPPRAYARPTTRATAPAGRSTP